MRIVLFILGGKVADNKPAVHFLLRTEAAIKYYEAHHESEDIVFLVSGRWPNVTDRFDENEAEIGKRYILERLPGAKVYKEDISVELIGNYAFSSPLIDALHPDKVVIPTSALMLDRNTLLAHRILDESYAIEFITVTDEQIDNSIMVGKEKASIRLFEALFESVPCGSDAGFRNILLYETPYYFKGIVDDHEFFGRYFEGGMDEYMIALNERDRI